ncbi:MAG: hypothetical protein ACREPX_12430 [Rhodanobacteraceae bacterium]
MGTEAVWIPLVLSAVATGATVYNQRATAKRQDDQLAKQIRAQTSRQHGADDKTKALIQAEANSTDADEKQGSLSKFTDALRQSQGNALRPLKVEGNASEAYKKAGSDSALGITGYGNQIADLVSSIDAPGQQRQNDSFTRNRYATDIDQIKRFSAGDDFLANMRLRGIKKNPWIDAGASALGGYASSMGGGYGGGYGAGANSSAEAIY